MSTVLVTGASESIGVTQDADFEIDSARRELGYAPTGFEEWLFTRTDGDPFWSR